MGHASVNKRLGLASTIQEAFYAGLQLWEEVSTALDPITLTCVPTTSTVTESFRASERNTLTNFSYVPLKKRKLKLFGPQLRFTE
jgi:hypothetical protein